MRVPPTHPPTRAVPGNTKLSNQGERMIGSETKGQTAEPRPFLPSPVLHTVNLKIARGGGLLGFATFTKLALVLQPVRHGFLASGAFV